MIIGILALQGGYAVHESKCRELNVPTQRIVNPEDLSFVSGLILPGGESTSIIKNLTVEMWQAIDDFSKERPIWGVCAGSILMACGVANPAQKSFSIIDIDIERNAYGAQNESFVADIEVNLTHQTLCECIFIRAPKIVRIGPGVDVLACLNDSPIMVQQQKHIATTFHPELGSKLDFHRYFLSKFK